MIVYKVTYTEKKIYWFLVQSKFNCLFTGCINWLIIVPNCWSNQINLIYQLYWLIIKLTRRFKGNWSIIDRYNVMIYLWDGWKNWLISLIRLYNNIQLSYEQDSSGISIAHKSENYHENFHDKYNFNVSPIDLEMFKQFLIKWLAIN